jgi:hypothetical protein
MVGTNIGVSFFTSGNSEYTFPGTRGYTSESNTLGVNINPSLGWFVSDNIVVGGLVSINIASKTTNNKSVDTTFSHNKNSQFNFGLGGFVRYYFNTTSGFKPFGQFNLSFGTGSTKNSGYVYSTDLTGNYKDTYDGNSSGDSYYNAGLNFGVTKLLNSFIGLDIYASYNYSYSKSTSKTTTNRHYTTGSGGDLKLEYAPTIKNNNHNFGVGVGFQIFLESKKK